MEGSGCMGLRGRKLLAEGERQEGENKKDGAEFTKVQQSSYEGKVPLKKRSKCCIVQ